MQNGEGVAGIDFGSRDYGGLKRKQAHAQQFPLSDKLKDHGIYNRQHTHTKTRLPHRAFGRLKAAGLRMRSLPFNLDFEESTGGMAPWRH